MFLYCSINVLLILYFVVYLYCLNTLAKHNFCGRYHVLPTTTQAQRASFHSDVNNHRRHKVYTCTIIRATFNSHNILWSKLISFLILTFLQRIPEKKDELPQ